MAWQMLEIEGHGVSQSAGRDGMADVRDRGTWCESDDVADC